MRKIQILTIDLINKIAAGEVIERPCSVVKELMENSLDAESTSLNIIVEEGGKKLIQISDNGHGIAEDDLKVVFSSHATSKIKTVEDLFRVSTFGFRGEALASIASVSWVKIISREKNSQEGYSIETRGSEISQVLPSAHPIGTTVQVRNIFFNTPVRKKFLKSNNVELGHSIEIITRMAISKTDVRFYLKSDGIELMNLPPANNRLERVAHFAGNDIAETLIPIHYESDDLSISGYISKVGTVRTTQRMIYTYLNERFIRDRLINKAINDAYKEFIQKWEFPVVYIFLTLPYEEVDINAHPTKIEVRFKNQNLIYQKVFETIKNTLLKSTHQSFKIQSEIEPTKIDEKQSAVEKEISDFFTGGVKNQQSEAISQKQLSLKTTPDGKNLLKTVVEQFKDGGEKNICEGNFLQVANSYILTECGNGVIIFDQHALHERILYNEIKESLSSENIVKQPLVVPFIIDITPPQMSWFDRCKKVFDDAGFEIEPFGHNTIAIKSIPTFLRRCDVRELTKAWIEICEEDGKNYIDAGLLDEFMHFMACKNAVKAGDRLEPQEISKMLQDMEKSEQTLTCAHGRPTSFIITLKDLEKYFHRT